MGGAQPVTMALLALMQFRKTNRMHSVNVEMTNQSWIEICPESDAIRLTNGIPIFNHLCNALQ